MNSVGGDVDIAVHDFPIPSIAVRTEELKRQLKDHPNIKIAAETTSDAANLIEGTRKTVTDQLSSTNLKGLIVLRRQVEADDARTLPGRPRECS